MVSGNLSAEKGDGSVAPLLETKLARYVAGEGVHLRKASSDSGKMAGPYTSYAGTVSKIPQYETLLLQNSTGETQFTIGRPGLIVGVQLAAEYSRASASVEAGVLRSYVTLNSSQQTGPASGDGAVLAILLLPLGANATSAVYLSSGVVFVPLFCPVRSTDKLFLRLEDPSPIVITHGLASAIIHFQYP